MKKTEQWLECHSLDEACREFDIPLRMAGLEEFAVLDNVILKGNKEVPPGKIYWVVNHKMVEEWNMKEMR